MTRLAWAITGILFAVTVFPTSFGLVLSVYDTWHGMEFELSELGPAIVTTFRE